MGKARIGIDIQSTFGKPTGLGIYTQNLYDGIRNITNGSDIVPIHSKKEDEFRTVKRITYDQIEKPFLAYKEKLDLFHITGFSAPFLYTKKKIITCHDLTPLLYPTKASIISDFYWRKILYPSITSCDFVITISENTKKDIINMLHISEEKIQVIYEGVDDRFNRKETFSKEALDGVKAKYHLPDIFALYVGTIISHKNLPVLADAMKGINIKLIVVGKTSPGQEIPKGSNIVLTGYVDEMDKPAIYALAKVFITPTLYEGFCIPAVEAMKTGIPVISSSASCMPEVCTNAAVYMNPLDIQEMHHVIKETISNVNLLNELGANGINNAKHFTWEKTCFETNAVYRRVLAM